VTKREISCIFSYKPVSKKGRVATSEFTIPIQIFLFTGKGFKKIETKNRSKRTCAFVNRL